MTLVDGQRSTLSIEKRIVKLLKRNEQGVIALIYRHYGYALFNVIFRILRDEALAQDVFQEVVIKIWRKGHSYNEQKGSLFTWLVSVCKHAAIDKTRSKAYRQARQTESQDQLVHQAADRPTHVTETHAQLRELITRLPETQRLIIELAYFQGYTHEEIAQQVEIPLGTVKTRIRLAIQKLRKHL